MGKQDAQVLEAERQARIEACKADLTALFEFYNCRLEVAIVITAQGNIPQVSIVTM